MATKPKLGIPASIIVTDENPADYVGDRYGATGAMVEAPPAVESGPGFMGRAKDLALTGIKSAIGVPEMAVGLADIATGGRVGKFLENEGGAIGFRPDQAKKYLDEFYTPQQQAAFRAVQQAANPDDPLLTRIGDTALAAVQNPSTIGHAVVESLGVMGAGGVLGRAVMTAAPRAAGWAAAGIGEGVASAGSSAEQIRQQTGDGLLTGKQAALAAGIGAATGGIGAVAARAAKAMGIGDIDVMLAGGGGATPTMQKGFARRVLEGAFTEGVMEELPQSIQEQVVQNYALGKPLDDGVDIAAVMGTLAGGAMGGGVQMLQRNRMPEVGPLSRAANLAAPQQPAVETVSTAGAPPAAAAGLAEQVPLTPEQQQMLLDHANRRAADLTEKSKGTKDTTEPGPDGEPVTVPGKIPEHLTPGERGELEFLGLAGGDVQALARAYPGLLQPAPAAPEVETVSTGSATTGGPSEPPKAPPGVAVGGPEVPVSDDDAEFDPNPPHLPTDFLSPLGKPFEFRAQAAQALRKQANPLDFTIQRVRGGFVLRAAQKGEPDASQPGGNSGGSAATGGQPAGDGAIGGPLPGGGVDGDSREPAARVPEADAVEDAGGVGDAVAPDDILNPRGEPFKEKGPAMAVQKKHPGSTLVQVPDGWVIRLQPTTLDANLAPIDLQPEGTRGTDAGDVVTVDEAANGAATSPDNDLTEPTDAQKKAGNYQKGHVKLNGLDLSIENPAGSTRSGVDRDGKAWENTLQHHYGYIRGTTGNDKDHVDLFVKPETPLDYAGPVFVVDQIHPDTGEFDEHKALVGFADEAEARAAYAANYAPDWKGLKSITQMDFDTFKAWVFDGPKKAPLAPEVETVSTDAPESGDGADGEPTGEAPTGSPAAGDATGGPSEPKPPKEKAEPKPPREPRPEVAADTPLKPADVRRALEALDDDAKAKFADADIKVLAGAHHAIAKTGEVLHFKRNADAPKKIEVGEGYATPAAERDHLAGNAKAANAAMARMIEGSDAAGIADALYEGIREVEADDLPLVFPDDKMIRLAVKIADRDQLESALKKAKFRISDRAQETDKSERIVLSALHMPERDTIGDAGAELGGKMKDRGGTETPPKDADAKAVEAFLDALHPSNHIDINSNPEQSFGAMMFKEAMADILRYPLDYLAQSLKRQFVFGYGMNDRAVIGEALKDDKRREGLKTLAEGYVSRLKLLQDTLHPATTTADAYKAFQAAYLDDGYQNAAGKELARISSTSPDHRAKQAAKLFENDSSTDQTHRFKKKDADAPPRLDRIVRVGMKDHRAGRDVNEDDFTKAFGFKGTEFGNWVNQIERQVNLNLAYDSLMDLADLTGLPSKMLGLADRLGMAIGARGQKNTRAAAHFEPGTNVINLTKTQGNGTVGHEWFHALDHNAAEHGNDSEQQLQARAAVNMLAEALQNRWRDDGVEDYLRGLLRDASASKDRNTPPKDAVFDAIRHSPKQRWGYGLTDGYRAVIKSTAFYRDARAMDGDKKYWSTPAELLARGFESYLFDASKGGTPYLVGPTRGDGVVTPQNGFKGTAYPRGEERQYVSDLYKLFFEQLDPKTLEMKPFKIKASVTEIEGLGFAVIDQHGAGLGGESHRLKFHEKKDAAQALRDQHDGKDAYLNVERAAVGRVNRKMLDVASRLDAIMEEMGIFRWPEIKNGTMSESMFYHLRQGWWPEDNAALIDYAAKAFRVPKSDIDRFKQKLAQEDFEAALGRYVAQRITDMRDSGSDERAIYDYIVELYRKQPVLDVQTGTSMANQAYSTPPPIAYLAGLLTRVKSNEKLFDPTAGNGVLTIAANPRNVIAIELEPRRAQNLRLMQYGKVIEGDTRKLMPTEIRPQEADVVHANPPFASLPKNADVRSWTGQDYELSKLDHLIAAEAMRAMADKGRAVLIIGAHREAGAITSADRVFLNWLHTNYNVADHFEVDGKMYGRMGASWPIRVLVIAGRNQTLTPFPRGYQVDRVYDFDQLWSRFNEARTRSEQVLVGAGKQLDQAGGANLNGAGVPAGDGGQTAGAGGARGDAAGIQDGGVADGPAGGDAGAGGRPGTTGGSTAGNGQSGRNGQGGGAVVGGAGLPGGRGGSGGRAGRPDAGGLSDLDDEDIDSLIDGALAKKPRAPRGEPTTGAGATSDTAPRGKRKAGKSLLDEIPGMAELFGDLDKALKSANDETPPEPPSGGEPAIERRKRLKSEKAEPKAVPPLQLGYTPQPMTAAQFNALNTYQHSAKTLARSMQAALDYRLEQESNPTAPLEKVSSRAMFSREMEEDAQYARVQPILAAVWERLTAAIADVRERITAFVTGLRQKFNDGVAAMAKRFLREMRDAQERVIPDRKTPIKAEAIDNETQVVYRGRSAGDSAGIFVPVKQAAALERAFDLFEARHGEVDAFVRAELGYESDEAMFKALGGYQIDGLALAIAANKDGNGFIIGDDTGVGKGRAAAALIAWAVKNGKVPIFFSFKDDLYSAMYDDLVDIGRGDTKLMATNRDAVIKSRDGKTVLKNTPAIAKAQADHIIKTGTLPEGVQAILTSYAQVNVPNERREAIARLVRDGKAVLIMDEAHNSAGESNTNEFFMRLLTGTNLFQAQDGDDSLETPPPESWEAPPTTYLSATFAKRPENMPVYVRTHLRHAAGTPAELVQMFKGGGDVMQQIASEYLVESGSMIRRERSYAGVHFGYLTDEENAPRDARLVDEVTKVLRQIVYADRAMKEWVESDEGQDVIATLIPPDSAIANVVSEDRRLDKSLFTSVVHNYIGQLLLATKVQKAVELGIEALNRGEKPVFALQNTMEAALDDFAGNEGLTDGDSIPGFGWQSILKRGVTSAQRVTLKSGTGKGALRERIIVPLNVMPYTLAREFKRAQELIEQFQSTLPGSPIDALRSEMGKYFVIDRPDGGKSYAKTVPEGAKARPLVIREITGREFGVDYAGDVPAYRRRQDPSSLDIILGYQGNYKEEGGRAKIKDANIDALIINSSGSTGISLHASVNAQDQRPRHMIVLQPNPDIAVFKQTLGRIHRTGQVEWPFFTVLATGIPAERRLLAVLKKKIGTLFSNTSGGEGSTGVDAVDFINVYGDAITKEYLEENPDVARFVGIDVTGDRVREDLALTASGRASLLSVDDQEAYFDTIEERFKQEIEMRNATGTNVLNRRAIDFQAELIGETMLEEGLDENNKFTSSALLRKYMINVVGDIPDADKVRAAIASSLNGRKPEQVVQEIGDSLSVAYDEAVNQLRLKQGELQESINAPTATDKEKQALTERLTALNSTISGFSARREATLSNLRHTYPIGAQYDSVKVGDVNAQGVVVGYTFGKSTAKSGNPFSPSNITVRFQRNVPSGPLGIPLSRLENQGDEVQVSGRQNAYRDNIDDWFSLRSVSGGRQERYIAGGNLLRARANVKGGEVLLHTLQGSTADDPRIDSGILMPKDWFPEATANTDFALRYPKAGQDYVLSVLRAINLERFKRYGDDEYKEKADALGAQARFIADFPNADDLEHSAILRGPANAWLLRTHGGAELRLTLSKSQGKLAKNKELQAITGEMAKKRGDDEFTPPQGRRVSDPADVARMVSILARATGLVVPEIGVPQAKELQQKHYAADNDVPPAAASRAPEAPEAPDGARRSDRVQSLAARITAEWKNSPSVVVARSIADPRVPASVRNEEEQAIKAGANPGEAFFYDGRVYLLSDRLPTDKDVARVMAHEGVGHFGMRGVFGGDFGAMLDRMAILNSAKVRTAAAKLGLDFEKQSERRMAAEEVLAYMAQNQPELGWVGRALAAIRTWARRTVPGFSKMGFSDAELIRDFILPARRWVEGGPDPKIGRVETVSTPAFSRGLGESLMSGLNNVRDARLPAGYAVSDLFDSSGKLHWWHKSVGTMYHLAQKSPPFKRVYDAVQYFLNDASYFAAEAAALAPSILPKLDKATDALPAMTLFGKRVGKSPLSPADTKALSGPVFEGTLAWARDEHGVAQRIADMDKDVTLDDKAHKLLRGGHITPEVLRMWQGLPMEKYEAIIEGKFDRELRKPGVVFTDAELREHFELSDRQIALYREFRAAIDKSVTDLAITEMLRYGGKDVDAMRDSVYGLSMQETAVALRDHLFRLGQRSPSRKDALDAAGNKMIEIADHAEDMIKRGYAPLSRFGSYSLEATDADGERYFSLHETTHDRARAARRLQADGASNIAMGTMSQQEHELFNGVTPETAALFGEMLGLDEQGDEAKDKAFQEYVKRGVANRSAMKRLLRRKGIAGFSEDAGRVLASFIFSNGRKAASNTHAAELTNAVNDIPKGEGELKDEAIKLTKYVRNPQEEAAGFRALLFTQYLGGSVASAMINATQPFAVTFPYLSQFGGARKSGARLAAALKAVGAASTGNADLDAALKKAEEEGIVSPQEIHSLQAQALGKAQLKAGDGTRLGNAAAKAGNALSKLSLAWGKVFGVAEQFNRRLTFIAAYNTALEEGISFPAQFAEKAVNETQFVYNKGNRPRWARGAVGATLFTFKQYSVNYVELLVRMATAGEPGSEERKAGQRAAVLALAVLFMMAGADGLPFAEDIQDVIDGAMQRIGGYNFSSKQKMKEMFAGALGRDGAEIVMNGFSGIPGVPIDSSGRLSMGNLIPGSGLLQKKTDYTRDLTEVGGAAADMVKRAFNAGGQAVRGDMLGAATTIAPVAARNVAKGLDMADTGMYRDDRGRKVVDATVAEAIGKGIGFQPRTAARVQEAGFEAQRQKAGYALAAAEIREKWARAKFENDADLLQEARDDLAAWNRKNPDQKIEPNMPAILRRVREMRKSKTERIADTAPKAIRASVRKQLAEELE